MSLEEIAAEDEKRSRMLDLEVRMEGRCRRCPKVDPPTKERIEEVTNAVLHRRMEALGEELQRRLKAKRAKG